MSPRTRVSLILSTLLILFSSSPLWANPNEGRHETQRTLVVGTKVAPPFVVKEPNGEFSGISIELWRELARRLNVEYEFKEVGLAKLVSGLEDQTLDISVAALTVTAAREKRVDFTHPFHSTGLSIAVAKGGNSMWALVKSMFSWRFILVVVSLGALLLFVGGLLWLAERKKNHAMFGGSPAEGIGASFWWAAVTMTTVGYGDKAPITFVGRIIGLIWMFAAIILISSFTAAIATSLTVQKLETAVQGLQDLPKVKVATVSNSASAAFLSDQGVGHISQPNIAPLIQSLSKGEIDALVYDKPILQYFVNQNYSADILVLPNTFDRQDYAIALRPGSPLREPINRALLELINEQQWDDVIGKYLGRSE